MKARRSICLACASILCLDISHVWEEIYLCSYFELEKSNKPNYKEKHCFLVGWPITWWVVLIKGLGSLPWIYIIREVFGFFLSLDPLVFLFALWSSLLALSWWWTQNNNDDDEIILYHKNCQYNIRKHYKRNPNFVFPSFSQHLWFWKIRNVEIKKFLKSNATQN